jgi:hypothetical protein
MIAKPVRTAVIGVGHLGRHHARILSELEGVQLVGVVDANQQRAQEIAEMHKTRALGAADLAGAVDAVVVATPTASHAEVACPLLIAGVAVLVEKPIARSLAEADAIFAAATLRAPSPDVANDDLNGAGVARYLRPEAEAVRFWGRPELDDLVRWAVSDDRVSIQLVIGAGGSGKTRLARQLGEKVAALGCRSWWVPIAAWPMSSGGLASTLQTRSLCNALERFRPARVVCIRAIEATICAREVLVQRLRGQSHPRAPCLARVSDERNL